MASTVYGDYSKWNGAVPSSYSYPILCFRADSGYGTDTQAAANWRMAQANKHIQMVIAYVVFIKGQNAATMSRLKGLFGATCPPGLAFRIDMESGSDFAGPGNHSTEANQLVALLADYAGDERRVDGYANTPDWASCWPNHPASLKRAVARYSSTPPTIPFYSWQYSDGSGKWGVPAGHPAPKGVDMNVIGKSIDDILDDYGLDWLSMATEAQVAALVSASEKRIEAAVSSVHERLDTIFSTIDKGEAKGPHNAEHLISMVVWGTPATGPAQHGPKATPKP